MNSLEGRCGFYVKRKHRYCKMLPAKGNRYCAEHLSEDKEYKGNLQRIQCPLDPKHSVFKDRLEKHLKKCNATRKFQEPYFEAGINAGLSPYEYSDDEKISLTSVSQEDLIDLIRRLKECYSKLNLSIAERFRTHQVLADELDKDEYGPGTRKHLRQQSSLIALLEEHGAFDDGSCFVEFGAGRGKLMHWIQKAMPQDAKGEYYLIDRQNNRHKYDCYHRGDDQGAMFNRLYIDIKDLNIDKVPGLQARTNLSAFGKHLCGAATDYTLRCLLDRPHNREQTQNVSPPCKKSKVDQPSSKVQPNVIIVALCCHHRCAWPSYVGRQFLAKHGFSPLDFHRLTAITSWAVCGFRERGHGHHEDTLGSAPDDSESQEECTPDVSNNTRVTDTNEAAPLQSLSNEEKKKMGKMAKRLIDYGRIKFVQDRGYNANFYCYVQEDVTPENVVLIAINNKASKLQFTE